MLTGAAVAARDRLTGNEADRHVTPAGGQYGAPEADVAHLGASPRPGEHGRRLGGCRGDGHGHWQTPAIIVVWRPSQILSAGAMYHLCLWAGKAGAKSPVGVADLILNISMLIFRYILASV